MAVTHRVVRPNRHGIVQSRGGLSTRKICNLPLRVRVLRIALATMGGPQDPKLGDLQAPDGPLARELLRHRAGDAMGKSYAEMMGASAHEASDALLPTQMFRSASTLRPEHRLMIAVLENAIESLDKDCRSQDERRLRACRQVEAWVRSSDTSSPFAFESICDALGLDADYVRVGLRRWRTRQRQLMPRVPVTPAGAPRGGSAETPKVNGQ